MNDYTRHSIFTFLIFLSMLTTVSAQGYHIEATIKGIKDTSVIIGHYNRSNTQFIPRDTAKADVNGKMVFEGTSTLPGGIYVILFPGNRRWAEVVYAGTETNFTLDTDTTDVIGNMKVTGSLENELFYAYNKELKAKSLELDAISKDKGPETQSRIRAAQDVFKVYRRKFLADHPNTFTAQLLRMSADPEIPAAPKLASGKTDSIWVFNYYKAHYWDAFDFSDSRILNTPFLEPKLDRYIKTLVVQTPDSLIREADMLLKKASGNNDVKAAVAFYITNQYENPKTVGTEAVWVHMAEKYYLTGEMGTSEDVKKRIAEKVSTLKALLVDKPFPALALTDPTGKKITVQSLAGNYTVLFFYAPTCGHCKEAAPLLKAFYDKKKLEGVKVMAVSTEHNQEEWKSFISTYHLEDLANGFDALKEIDFVRKFDVVTTPTLYVLDKNKKIIARKMPVEQLEDFLNYYQNKMAGKL